MRYYGITIGPIVETLYSTTKPAGLWMGSYFFSSITRDICTLIQDEETEIIAPYFEKGESETLGKADGIGRFNDHIIFKYTGSDEKKFDQTLKLIFEAVKTKRADEIYHCLNDSDVSDDDKKDDVKKYIDRYVNIRCIGVREEDIEDNNALKTLSYKLDCLELMEAALPSGTARYMAAVLNDNERVKNFPDYEGASEVLSSNGRIKKLEDIAEGDGKLSRYKSRKYFAVVYADGDHIGKVIERLGCAEGDKTPEDRQRDFSAKCLEYTQSSAKLINSYGGLTIYAGGDDLLFLAPLRTENQDIFELCSSITQEFDTIFSAEQNKLGENGPSLSYGISINYYKYPLYEAVEDARRLLFEEAKKEFKGDEATKGKRIYNSIALALRKASGQKMELVIGQQSVSFTCFKEIYKKLLDIDRKDVQDRADELSHNVIFTLEKQKKVITRVWQLYNNDPMERRCKVLRNFFDNEAQKNLEIDLITKLGDAVDKEHSQKLIRISEANDDTFVVDGITAILRICKFFIEKGDEMNG